MINIKVRDYGALKKKIDDVAWGLKGVVTMEYAKYYIGNERRGLQYYPPQRTKTPYQRTYKFRFGWVVNSWESGTKTSIQNKVPYAKYVNTRWAGAPWKWRTINEIFKDNSRGAQLAAEQAVARHLKEKGL
jgi:hypothetical protein